MNEWYFRKGNLAWKDFRITDANSKANFGQYVLFEKSEVLFRGTTAECKKFAEDKEYSID